MLLTLAMLASLSLPTSDTSSVLRPVRDDDVTVTVTIDSSKHVVASRRGPSSCAHGAEGPSHADGHGVHHDTPVYHFAWPVDGWLRGFKTNVVDADGGRCRSM